MRLLFAGSPDVAVPSLRALHMSGHDVVGVISQPARPVGRKRLLTPTPVSQAAGELGLSVHTPETQEELRVVVQELQPDLAVTVAYGRLIGPTTLAIPSRGWWNVHFSLLPRWRGATPVQHTLLHGDAVAGVTIFQLDEGLDAGDILHRREHPVPPDATAGTLLTELAELGARMLVETLELAAQGTLRPTPQDGESSYAPKLSREEGLIRWGESGQDVYNRFRAVTPEPGAYAVIDGGNATLALLDLAPSNTADHLAPGEVALLGQEILVGTADQPVALREVQPAGRKPMTARAWWNGAGGDVRFAP